MTDRRLTLHEAAASLGVHYMTVYRYVRLGLLPAEKVGGSWQVTESDLTAFATPAAADDDEPVTRGGRRPAPWSQRLEARLVAGDGPGAWGVIEAALAGGCELDAVYLDVIAPAMASIGERWSTGDIDVAVEHRATGIALRLVARLGPRFARRGRSRGTVVVGAPAGEDHSLPIAMLADLVRGAGWDVSDLGADLPDDAWLSAVAHVDHLSAVGVSVTVTDRLPAAAVLLAALRGAVDPSVLLAVGGAAVHDIDQARALGADVWAPDARSFIDLLATHRR